MQDSIVRDGYAYATYIGLTLKSIAAYQAPLSMSLNYFAAKSSNSKEENVILFLMNYNLF